MNRYRARELRAIAIPRPTYVQPRRGSFLTAKVLTALSLSSLLGRSVPRVSPSNVIGDLRRYNPTRSVAAPAAFSPAAVRLVAKPRVRSSVAAVGFAAPASVLICRRRQMRKEVIHAKGIAGSRVSRPRRNVWSDVIC